MDHRGCFRILWEIKHILLFLFVPIVLLPVIFNVGGDAGKCAYAVLILAIFWVFDVLPLPVTSLLPVLLFPVFGIMTTTEVSAEYFKDTSITVLGIFCLVAGIERWGLHRRLALRILMLFGSKPHWLILGMLTCATVLSMLLTVGVAIMLLPIVRTMMYKLKNVEGETDIEMNNISKKIEAEEEEVTDDDSSDDSLKVQKSNHDLEIARLYKALTLCVAYGTTIGATATLTGSPSNFIMLGLADQFFARYGLSSGVTFISWMIFALPMSVIIMVLTWVWFVIFFLRGKGIFRRQKRTEELEKVEESIKRYLQQEYVQLGSWKYPEIMIVAFIVLLILLFFTKDLYFVPGWDSFFKKRYVGAAAPAVTLCVLLFIIPAASPRELLKGGKTDGSRFAPLLQWKEVSKTIPWGIMILIGAAFSIVKACKLSGLTKMIGQQFATFTSLEPWLLTIVMTTLTTAMTEFISNAATIAMLLPIAGQMAIQLNLNPLALMFPLTMAAKFAYMMPISTPPNAIVYSLGSLKIKDMAAAGFAVNIISLVTLNIAAETWGKAYFQWDIIPDAMRINQTLSFDANSTLI